MTPTAAERRRAAIAHARARRDHDLAPLRAEVRAAIEAVGWPRAKPLVAQALAPRWHVGGPRGPWWGPVGKRAGARILADLGALPAQGRLALSQPRRRVPEAREVR